MLSTRPDLIVLEMPLPRGHPGVEAMLDAGIPLCSGAQWLGTLLPGRHVLAVAGTHGNHHHRHADLDLGMRDSRRASIGGVARPPAELEGATCGGSGRIRLSSSIGARSLSTTTPTVIINNLEYDHADIFPDLKAIQINSTYPSHHPSIGEVVYPEGEDAIEEVLARWSTRVPPRPWPRP